MYKEDTALTVRHKTWQQRNVPHEKAQLWLYVLGVEAGVKGQMNYELLDTTTYIHHMESPLRVS